MPTAAEILIRIIGESSGLSKELDKSKRDIGSFTKTVEQSGKAVGIFGNIVQGIFQGIGQAAFNAATRGFRSLVDEIGKSVKAASDFNESLNKITVAFGDSSREILEWSKTSATAFGQSQRQALEAASSFGLLFRTMGLANAESAEMSIRLTELASDLASINNISPEEALIKLRAGLVGEVEPLRTVGVLLNAANVEQKALALGLANSTSEISEQDKVLARYQLILEQTTLAQGDFARTADGIANAQRTLSAQIENFRTKLGQAFTPVFAVILNGLNELVAEVTGYGDGIVQALATGMVNGIIALLPVMAQLRSFFAYWLESHSPPRLLPDLTKWAQGALKAYMEGWADPDFTALRELGSNIENALRSFAGAGKIKETDLVSRIFGSGRALTDAINEWRQAGAISIATLDNIRRAAGPASESVGDLVNAYFNLQTQTRKTAEAQANLDAVTRRYDATLSPLQQKLNSLEEAQSDLNDQERLGELAKIINDRRSSVGDRQKARLEQEQILLRDQIDAIEDERDAAVDAEQKKLDAAEQERKAKEDAYNQAKSLLDQQIQTNALIQEEITLRQRLADEALAKEEKERRELEAQRKKEETELQRIYDAHLRYRLAVSDTEGQLAIMREELKKTTEGSADYYDILTQIAQLEERLRKEREKDEDTAAPELGIGEDLVPQWVTDLTTRLRNAWEESLGKDAPRVELNPFFKNAVKAFEDIGGAVTEAGIIVKGFIDLFTGKSQDVPTADILRPAGGGGGFFSGILSFMRGLLSNLTLLFNGEWVPLWNNFKVYVNGLLTMIDPAADPNTFAFYKWLDEVLIPAVEALGDGDWRTAWELLGAKAMQGLLQGLLGAEEYTTFSKAMAQFNQGDIIGAWKTLAGGALEQGGPIETEKPQFETPPGGPLTWQGELSVPFWKQIIENLLAYIDAMRKATGLGDIEPQSFGLPGVVPATPAIASVAGMGGNTTTTTSTQLGPINLVFNVPVTPEVAAQAARTVDDELRSRGWSPT